VVSRLDEAVARYLEAGGTALFLARSPSDVDPNLAARTGLRVRDRRARIDERTKEKNPWEGDWVSNFNWVKHDPLFQRIPRVADSPLSGELMDMQYYRVIPNQVLLGWSPEREFADIHSGMVVGWVHAPVTLMGQCRWGNGRLFATTLKLESAFDDDPVATVLLHNLLAYLGSSRFRPQKDALAPRRPQRAEAPSEGVTVEDALAAGAHGTSENGPAPAPRRRAPATAEGNGGRPPRRSPRARGTASPAVDPEEA
jgi:hypothetical protein